MNRKAFTLVELLACRGAAHGAKRSKVFTLVELLVVVVIIAILAAILLPVLNKARYVARVSGCTSNMHQIALAYATYAGDNDMYYPMNGSMRTINAGFTELGSGSSAFQTKKIIAPYFGVDVDPGRLSRTWVSDPDPSREKWTYTDSNNYSMMDRVFMCPLVAGFASNYTSYNIFAAANYSQDAGQVGDGTGPTPIVFWPDATDFRLYSGNRDILTDGWSTEYKTGESNGTINRYFRPTGGFMFKVGQPWYSKGDKAYYNVLIGDRLNGWGYTRQPLHHELQPDFVESSNCYTSPYKVYPPCGGNFAGEDGSVKEYIMAKDSSAGFGRVGSEYIPEDFRVENPY